MDTAEGEQGDAFCLCDSSASVPFKRNKDKCSGGLEQTAWKMFASKSEGFVNVVVRECAQRSWWMNMSNPQMCCDWSDFIRYVVYMRGKPLPLSERNCWNAVLQAMQRWLLALVNTVLLNAQRHYIILKLSKLTKPLTEESWCYLCNLSCYKRKSNQRLRLIQPQS